MDYRIANNRALQVALSRRARGLGFLDANDYGDGGYYWEDAFGNWGYQDSYGSYGGDASGGYWDSFGTYNDPSGFDWPMIDANFSLPLDTSAGSGAFNDPYGPTSTGSLWDYINSFLQVDSPGVTSSTNTGGSLPAGWPSSQPFNLSDWFSWPSYRDVTGSLDHGSNAPIDASYPGYCSKGTYHPVNNPYACVPFPPDDPNGKKARQQQQQQQKANAAARAAQKKQDQQCPKGYFKNPTTGKCQPIPQCPQGTAFDSRTQKCLTPAQAKELYGQDWSWLWLVLAGVVGVKLLSDEGNYRRGRK